MLAQERDMEKSVQNVIERCAEASYAGTISFPAVVAALNEAGVEAYHADYRRRTTTYYLASGSTHTRDLPAPALDIPTPVDAAALQAAIQGSQRGEVVYREFLKLSMASGCVGYSVWISGRQVTYFGRMGEIHVERFPS
jgi:uncharacterized protein YbcV (DUF1398 family)